MTSQVFDRISINEDALLVDMRMKIQTEFDMIIIDHFEKKFLNGINLRFLKLVWISIRTIEILSSGICSEITLIDTVRIYDRDDVEDKFLQ